MGFFQKLFGSTKQSIEGKRWGWIQSKVEPDEQQVVTTPAWVILGQEYVGGHVFLTSRAVYTATTQPPMGSESDPFVVSATIDSVSRLAVTDVGLLYWVNPDSRGNDASNLLDLYPSALSQKLVREFRNRWTTQTGSEPEGNWDLWLADDAPMPARAARSWRKGPGA